MRNRSAVEIIIITFTFVVAIILVSLSFGLIYTEIRNPEADTTVLTSTLMSLTSAILGTLFGMLIAKGDRINRRPDEKEDNP